MSKNLVNNRYLPFILLVLFCGIYAICMKFGLIAWNINDIDKLALILAFFMSWYSFALSYLKRTKFSIAATIAVMILSIVFYISSIYIKNLVLVLGLFFLVITIIVLQNIVNMKSRLNDGGN